MPRDPKRQKYMLQLIAQLWERHPDLRIGQLMWAAKREATTDTDIFYTEDDEFQAGMEKLLGYWTGEIHDAPKRPEPTP